MLRPSENGQRKYVLWAGSKDRPAKNYPLMEEVMQGFDLPAEYEFKVLTGYPVQDYWDLLDKTAVVVNTSHYESFCCAAFEAMAKGVPVIWRQGLQGGVHEAAGVRVAYEAGAYREAILGVLSGQEHLNLGRASRQYCEMNASLAVMGEDLAAVYREVVESKS
jgi:glycosyltransferase involved in cell wall biosynthesis